jgi:hypothetical protein
MAFVMVRFLGHDCTDDLIRSFNSIIGNPPSMDCRVSYEHSPASAPEDFIVKVPSQLVEGVPTNIPRARRPEFISDLIRKRSVHIGKIRKLRLL